MMSRVEEKKNARVGVPPTPSYIDQPKPVLDLRETGGGKIFMGGSENLD